MIGSPMAVTQAIGTLRSSVFMGVLVPMRGGAVAKAWHTLASHPLALALAVLWVVLNVVIAVAATRNAFHADPREQAMEARTLAEYSARAIGAVPHMTTTGALGKVLPAAVNPTSEESI